MTVLSRLGINKLAKYFNCKNSAGDSKIEIRRYNELLYLESLGAIKNIQKQPQFILQDGFRYKDGERKETSIKYTADFQYYDNRINQIVIEEIKSKYTKKLAGYSIRRRLFKYSIKDRSDISFKQIVY